MNLHPRNVGFAIAHSNGTIIAHQHDADLPPTTAVYARPVDALERCADMAETFGPHYRVVELIWVDTEGTPDEGAPQ